MRKESDPYYPAGTTLVSCGYLAEGSNLHIDVLNLTRLVCFRKAVIDQVQMLDVLVDPLR